MRPTRRRAPSVAPLLLLALGAGCRSRSAPEMASTAEPPVAPVAAPAGSNAAARATSPAPAPTVNGAWSTPGKAPPGVTRFVAIGDFGAASEAAQRVAELVLREQPDFVITLGDNNYPTGSADTIDANIGRFYSSFIAPYEGRYGPGAKENRFFPSLGNHDWMTAGARPYLDYFTLPGNERYYDIEQGSAHLFALDSDPHEPDGIDARSVQARWLKEKATASKKTFQIVYMHHPPYSSSRHGSAPVLQWPYEEWGVDLVLAGHDHTYERIEANGLVFVVNGLGGHVAYGFDEPIPGSKLRFSGGHGALFVEVTKSELSARFLTTDGKVIDQFSIAR